MIHWTAIIFGIILGVISSEIFIRYRLFRAGVLEVRNLVKNVYTYEALKVTSQTRVYINDEGKNVWFHRGRLHELNKPKYEEYKQCVEKL